MATHSRQLVNKVNKESMGYTSIATYLVPGVRWQQLWLRYAQRRIACVSQRAAYQQYFYHPYHHRHHPCWSY